MENDKNKKLNFWNEDFFGMCSYTLVRTFRMTFETFFNFFIWSKTPFLTFGTQKTRKIDFLERGVFWDQSRGWKNFFHPSRLRLSGMKNFFHPPSGCEILLCPPAHVENIHCILGYNLTSLEGHTRVCAMQCFAVHTQVSSLNYQLN